MFMPPGEIIRGSEEFSTSFSVKREIFRPGSFYLVRLQPVPQTTKANPVDFWGLAMIR
jgi:hypothetical protein